MPSPGVSGLLKFVISAVVLALAVTVGVYVGSATRSVTPQPPQAAEVFPNLKLTPGEPFPDVDLLNEDNQPLTSHEAVGDNGAIVIFMDLGCDPCERMTGFVQELIDNGDLPTADVIGIAPTTPIDYLDAFYSKHGLTFPIYADTAATFMTEHGVEGYPIMIAVDSRFTVTDINLDSRRPIPRDFLSHLK